MVEFELLPPLRSLRSLRVALENGGRPPAQEGCANHRTPYGEGGLTTLDDGELICPRHHTLVHQGFTYPRRT